MEESISRTQLQNALEKYHLEYKEYPETFDDTPLKEMNSKEYAERVTKKIFELKEM